MVRDHQLRSSLPPFRSQPVVFWQIPGKPKANHFKKIVGWKNGETTISKVNIYKESLSNIDIPTIYYYIKWLFQVLPGMFF